jgi:hypothetical protein
MRTRQVGAALSLTVGRRAPILQRRDLALARFACPEEERFGMSKVKMRCARCSKSFKSSDAKQTLCLECAAKERLSRAKGNASQPAPAKHVPPPKIIGPAAGGSGAPAGVHFTPPPDTGAFGAAARRAEQDQRGQREAHREHGHPDGHPTGSSAAATQPRGSSPAAAHPAGTPAAPGRNAHEHGAASSAAGAQPTARGGTGKGAHAIKPAREPKPPKERQPPPPQELTPEQRAAVEQRYLELAQPAEFDGIRTQIAAELRLSKALVRKAILELRLSRNLPSWWEMQGFPGSSADLDRVRTAYLPVLPVPPIGVHKQLAAQLGLEPHAVYKGIRQIRSQMGLPQFNPPERHPEYVRPEAAAAAVTGPEHSASAGAE